LKKEIKLWLGANCARNLIDPWFDAAAEIEAGQGIDPRTDGIIGSLPFDVSTIPLSFCFQRKSL